VTEYLPLLYIGGVMAVCLVFLLILRVTGIEAAEKRRQRARAARLRAKMMAEAEAARYRLQWPAGASPPSPSLGPTSYGEVLDLGMRSHHARRGSKR
jgi:hypothetical protein